ncbi:hypothetical protein MHYP_G00083780 [Metynnis hypsauchen]
METEALCSLRREVARASSHAPGYWRTAPRDSGVHPCCQTIKYVKAVLRWSLGTMQAMCGTPFSFRSPTHPVLVLPKT